MSIFEQIANKLGMPGSPKDEGTPLNEIVDLNQQHPDETRLVAYIRDKLEYARQSNSRISIEQNYMSNLAYLLGYDGVTWDVNYRQFKNADPKRKLTRNRFRINKILPTVQNRLARLTQSPPKYDVRPESNDSDDKDAARLSLQILEDVFDKQHFVEKRQDLLMCAMQGGHAYIQVILDPSLGKPMIDPKTGQLDGYEGEVRLEVLNCLEVFPDPLAKKLEDCQWIIKAKVRKLEYFRETYPERGKAVKEEDAWLLSSLYDLKSNALTNVGIGGSATTDQQKNSAIEIVYYEKRCRDYHNGRKIVCANGVLLEDKELPVGEYDIVKFDDVLIGGRYNPEAIITHLRPIQDQYNIQRTKMAEWIRKCLAGKYLAPKGAGLSQEALNDQSGEVIEYNPVLNAGPVQPLPIPSIPQFAYTDLDTLDSEFDTVSGIGETSQGKLEASGMPATLGQLLQEQDQTRISVQSLRNEIGYAKVSTIILKYVSKYYKMPRLLKLAGEGLDYAVKDFVGEDIGDNTDVICIPGSTVPNSKVLKRQEIFNAYNTGLLGDPADPKLRAKVLKMMEYGDVEEMWKSQALDEAQIKKAIETVENEQLPPLHEMDNHVLYVSEFNDYRKQDKYESLSPKAKMIFNYVMEWHLQAEVKLRNPQIPEQQMMAEQMNNNLKTMFPQGGQMPQGMGENDPMAQAQMAQPPMESVGV